MEISTDTVEAIGSIGSFLVAALAYFRARDADNRAINARIEIENTKRQFMSTQQFLSGFGGGGGGGGIDGSAGGGGGGGFGAPGGAGGNVSN